LFFVELGAAIKVASTRCTRFHQQPLSSDEVARDGQHLIGQLAFLQPVANSAIRSMSVTQRTTRRI
jgi:hypothetical protein